MPLIFSKLAGNSLCAPSFALSLVVLLVLATGTPNSLARATNEYGFNVSDINPEPRYGPTFTEIHAELEQLKDGKIAASKMWTRPNAVGWVSDTPVHVRLDIEPEGQGRLAKVRLHSANSTGVPHVRRIDMYGEATGRINYLGMWPPSVMSTTVLNGPLWLESGPIILPPRLHLVMHAGDRVLAVDEIRLEASESTVPPTQPVEVGNSILADSSNRFRSSLLEEQRNADRQFIIENPAESEIVMVDAFGSFLPSSRHTTHEAPHTVYGNGDHVWLAALISNRSEEEVTGQISLGGFPEGSAAYFVVPPIGAFPGVVVFDALESVPDRQLTIPRESIARVMVKLSIHELEVGEHQSDLSFTPGGGGLLAVPLVVMVTKLPEHKRIESPRAVVWAYESSLPIWKRRRTAIDELKRAGINVNVVHPKLIPGETRADFDYGAAEKLRRLLNSYDAGTIHLLALAWDVHHAGNEVGMEQKEWIEDFTKWIRGAKKNGRWLVYILDEPRKRKAEQMIAVAREFKRTAPDIELYANPIAKIDQAHLVALEPLISVWQPDYSGLQRHRAFFERIPSNRKWFYQNPRYGAKSEEPVFYRALAWTAVANRLSGLGFWSFSDTQGSSAWDDFDSRRPDWAVVYESRDGIRSSRRWEGFKSGLHDFVALESALENCPDILAVLESLEIKNPRTAMKLVQERIYQDACLSPR